MVLYTVSDLYIRTVMRRPHSLGQLLPHAARGDACGFAVSPLRQHACLACPFHTLRSVDGQARERAPPPVRPCGPVGRHGALHRRCVPSGARSPSTARRGTAIAARTLSLPRSSTANTSPKNRIMRPMRRSASASARRPDSRARAASVSDSLDLSGLVRPLGPEPLDAPNRSASLRTASFALSAFGEARPFT